MNEKVVKDWGWYQVLYEEENFLVKKLVIEPKKSISYQRHFKREETWTIVEGNAVFVLNENANVGGPGSTFDVPVEGRHKVINLSNKNDLVCIEIWRRCGENGVFFGELDEDDIERVG